MRKEKAALTVSRHMEKMYDLEAQRKNYIDRSKHGLVLATNYELVSHASRALALLRRAEELADGGPVSLQSAEKLRRYLTSRLEIPAIPRGALQDTPEDEIERLFQKWLDEGLPAERRGQLETAEDVAAMALHNMSEMSLLENKRDQYASQVEIRSVLDMNYLISSRAKEALESLLEAESLSEPGEVPLFPGDKLAEARRRLARCRDLPAVPSWEQRNTPEAELQRLYELWLLGRTGSE
jgi:hypothetical protein